MVHMRYYAVSEGNQFTQADDLETIRKDMENMKQRKWSVYEKHWESDGLALKEVRPPRRELPL